MYDRCSGDLLGNWERMMEYTLYGFLYIIQRFFNLLLDLRVAENVSLGGIIVSVMILGALIYNFGMDSGSSSKSTKSNSTRSSGNSGKAK